MGRTAWCLLTALAFWGAALAKAQPSDAVLGQVLTPDGKPAANATVWLVVHRWEQERPSVESTATTNSNGQFRLPFKPPLRVYFAAVVAHMPPFGVAAKGFDPRDLKPMTLRLSPAASLSGVIVTPDGQPLAKAVVTVRSVSPLDDGTSDARLDVIGFFLSESLPEEVSPLRVVTDERGRFSLPYLPAQTRAWVVVQHPEFPEANFRVPVGASDVFLAMAPPVILRGRVVSDGRPVPNATVQCRAWDREIAVRTDEQGRFQLIIPPSAFLQEWDAVIVYAWMDEGRQQSLPQRVFLENISKEIVLTLQPATLVTGVVKDAETKAPVPFAAVRATRSLFLPRVTFPFATEDVRADEQGRFQIFLFPGEWDLAAWASYAPGHYTDTVQKITVGNEPLALPDILLPRGTLPQVRVVNEKGDPVPNALVVFSWGDAVRTDEQGECILSISRTRTLSVWAFSPNYRLVGRSEITPESGKVQIVVREGVPVTGQVVDEQDRPIPNAAVTVWHLTRDWSPVETPFSWFTVRADEQGRFRLSLPPNAPFQIAARAPGFWTGRSERFTLREGEPLVLPPIRLPHADAVIEGVVVDDETGKPVVGAVVRLVRLIVEMPTPLECYTDFSGRFFLSGLREGMHRLEVQHPAYQEVSVEVKAPAADVRITLSRLLPISAELAVGQPLPPLTDAIWLDGAAPSFTGTTTYLLFATPYEPNCEEALRKLKELQAQKKVQVVVIFDASLPVDELKEYVQEMQLPFRVGTVAPKRRAGWDSETFQRCGVKSVPMLVVIDEKGVVTTINPPL